MQDFRYSKITYKILPIWGPYHKTGLQIYGGPSNCPKVSKYGPSLPKAVGPVDPSFLVVKKSHFNKNVHLTACLQKVHVCCQYSKTCLKQPLKKKDKTKILITNGSLMKV